MGIAGQALKAQVLLLLINHHQAGACAPAWGQHGCSGLVRIFTMETHGQGLTGLANQADRQGNHQGLLGRLPGGGRRVLLDMELQHPCLPIPVTLNPQHRGACLLVPAPELGEIQGSFALGSFLVDLLGRILHRLDKILTGGRRAVMATHIQGHASHEGLLTQQGMETTDHLRSFLVDRRCVEVVDRLVGIGLHGVCRRT